MAKKTKAEREIAALRKGISDGKIAVTSRLLEEADEDTWPMLKFQLSNGYALEIHIDALIHEGDDAPVRLSETDEDSYRWVRGIKRAASAAFAKILRDRDVWAAAVNKLGKRKDLAKYLPGSKVAVFPCEHHCHAEQLDCKPVIGIVESVRTDYSVPRYKVRVFGFLVERDEEEIDTLNPPLQQLANEAA